MIAASMGEARCAICGEPATGYRVQLDRNYGRAGGMLHSFIPVCRGPHR